MALERTKKFVKYLASPVTIGANSIKSAAAPGASIIRDLLAQLKRKAARQQDAVSSARERFVAQVARYNLDKRKLEMIEADLVNRKRVLIAGVVLLPAIVAWLAIDGSPFAAAGCAFFMPYIGAHILRNGIRLRQVRDRAGYQWREFLALFPSMTALVGYLLDPEF